MENLSNEIFGYLDGYDINKAFSNLNTRLNSLFLHFSFLMKIHFSSSNILDHVRIRTINWQSLDGIAFFSYNLSSMFLTETRWISMK